MDQEQRIKAAQCVLIVVGLAAYRMCFKREGDFDHKKVVEYSKLLGKLIDGIEPEEVD